jgi:predicted MFS family arabinose efflux permease
MTRKIPVHELSPQQLVLALALCQFIASYAGTNMNVATFNILTFVPGLLLMGVGVGAMLTSSVNVVQSSFPEQDHGEIPGLSRSVSNLGSSLGTAIAGSVLVSTLVTGNRLFALALATIAVIASIGLFAAVLLPRETVTSTRPSGNHG